MARIKSMQLPRLATLSIRLNALSDNTGMALPVSITSGNEGKDCSNYNCANRICRVV